MWSCCSTYIYTVLWYCFGFGQDIKDVSDWSKDKLQNSDEEEVIENEEEVIYSIYLLIALGSCTKS